MKILALSGIVCGILAAGPVIQARDNGWTAQEKLMAPAKPSNDVAGKIREMPLRTRKSMSSVVGWSPISDVERIPLRAKDVYRITYEMDGRSQNVFIDEFGEVMGEPGLK
ncbi:MAG TPA: hypothetical protein VHI52_02685 [Verrucomicrobiae bacterium]|nr:hypothetical protein [Verrucomicrobiae bacterium]